MLSDSAENAHCVRVKEDFFPGKTPAQLLFCSSRGHHVRIPLLPSTLAESALTQASSPSPGPQADAGDHQWSSLAFGSLRAILGRSTDA